MATVDLAARTNRAVAAAAAVGRDLGLTVTEPRVLYDFFSVVVHLAPAPVVVRVPAVLPRTVTADPQAQAAQQRRELAVAGWLADRGHPSSACARWTSGCCASWSPRAMQAIAYLTLAPQLPGLAEGVRPSIDHWRTTPLAGGLPSRRSGPCDSY